MSDGQPAALRSYLDGLAALGGAVSAVEALVVDVGEGANEGESPDTAPARRTVFRHAAGFRVGGEKLRTGARFDIASLTKPWMATLALVLDAKGELALGHKVGEVFGEKAARFAELPLEDLLRHRSGIRAWTPIPLRLGTRRSDRDALTDLLFTESLWERRNDTVSASATVYSDLGYILWGLAAEKVTGFSLPDLLDRCVCEPLGLAPLGALAAEPLVAEVVECRLDNGKEVDLAAEQGLKLARQKSFFRGRPQDGNARSLPFLAAHAGLFATADELLALAREWLQPGKLLVKEGVRSAVAGTGEYALGWARQDDVGSSGPAFSSASFGHVGFTGGSLWINPERGRICVLLAHRLSSRHDFNPVRREFHRLAMQL
ncbi:MAG: serine hydrolase domain-containing protein [Thermoanaerobaculia bacterium]